MSHSTRIVTHICNFIRCHNNCMSHSTGILLCVHDSYCDSYVRSEIPSQQLRQYMGHSKGSGTHRYQVLFFYFVSTFMVIHDPLNGYCGYTDRNAFFVHYIKIVLIEIGLNFVSNEMTSNDLGFFYQRFFWFGKLTLKCGSLVFQCKIDTNAHWLLARYSTKCVALFTISY